MESEIQGYLTEFRIIKGDITAAVKGLNDEAGNWCPLKEGTNSIYALLAHLTGGDNFWVRQIINGEKLQRNREAEFKSSGSLNEMVSRWEKSWSEIEAILGKLKDSQLSESRPSPHPVAGKETVTIQWIILHLITHHATHLGHIQLTRQLWEQKQK